MSCNVKHNGHWQNRLFCNRNSNHPKCFEGEKSLPIDYITYTKAWMTKLRRVFEDWLKKYDKEMQMKRRKIALLLTTTALPK